MCEYLTILFYASEAQSKNEEKEKVREKEKVLERLEGMKRKIGQRGREKGIKRGKRKLKKQRCVENSAQPVGDRKGDFSLLFQIFSVRLLRFHVSVLPPFRLLLSRFPFTFLDSFQSAHSHTRHGACFPGSS